jgi:ribA/ribD-fused uncharacterized protein
MRIKLNPLDWLNLTDVIEIESVTGKPFDKAPKNVIAKYVRRRFIEKHMKKIESFHGEYRFLSNFYPSIVEFEKVLYPTAEHAYQAAKTLDPKVRQEIARCTTPGEAKRMGKCIALRPNWDNLKLTAMAMIVGDKFYRHPDLADKLLATKDAVLIEGNWWGDTFWGVCKGKGENHLGKLLEGVRCIIRNDREREAAHKKVDEKFKRVK